MFSLPKPYKLRIQIMRTVSVSSPGDKLNLPPLPDNVDKDVNDWF